MTGNLIAAIWMVSIPAAAVGMAAQTEPTQRAELQIQVVTAVEAKTQFQQAKAAPAL